MFNQYKQFVDKYYHFWLRLANFEKKASIFPINFDKHWLHVIGAKKGLLTVATLCIAFIQCFYAIYPLLIEKIVHTQNFTYFLYLMGLWLFIIVLEFVSVYCASLLEVQCVNSILYNSIEHFLTVDPLYHTLKSTGKLFMKVERCARAYENFIDMMLWDILPVIISVASVTITFFFLDYTLGLICFILLLMIAIVNIILNLFTSAAFEQNMIDADDTLKAVAVESLTQVQLIRSSFATDEIADLTKQKAQRLMTVEGTAWLAFTSSVSISRLFYVGSILILGSVIFSLMQAGSLSVTQAVAVLFTYINGTYEIIEIGRRIRKVLRATTRIDDLYLFIQMFGKQTFPVLQGSAAPSNPEKTGPITVSAKDIHFYYNPQAKIFDDHTFYLEVPRNQQAKLYGIIGPSGIGKTTFLSLLGGQLKPDKGTVLVDGVPVYGVTDEVRRRFICTQGQIASSLSGTVYRNLLLGLPHDRVMYTHDEIIDILQKVGIWDVFNKKQGLETPIGESGLTLSGGQRQRLNFASLYLRAKYYKPALILIDEPTSSLDEVSEMAITKMISELAENALTIVIAHRLKTIEEAVGIFDFSLIDKEKDIIFYPRDVLEKKSTYYQRLIQGAVPMEDQA
jgi:ABC-type multidrug transport system fused ATPase/permease subunit